MHEYRKTHKPKPKKPEQYNNIYCDGFLRNSKRIAYQRKHKLYSLIIKEAEII